MKKQRKRSAVKHARQVVEREAQRYVDAGIMDRKTMGNLAVYVAGVPGYTKTLRSRYRLSNLLRIALRFTGELLRSRGLAR